MAKEPEFIGIVMNKSSMLRALPKVIAEVDSHIAANSEGGRGSSAGEGYAGGYRDCLRDVEAMLSHGYPSDVWRFWQLASRR
jgi:hypothetical protein